MAGRIGIQLDKDVLDMAPGEAAAVQISVTNNSDVVDQFSLKVDGLQAGWYVLPEADVKLFPRQSADVTLRLTPPKGSGAAAGPRVFIITAVSRDNPAEITTAQVRINLAASGAAGMALTLQPQRISGRKGLYAVKISNPGNSALPIMVTATDPDEALQYTLGTPQEQPLGDEGAEPYKPNELGRAGLRMNGVLQEEIEVAPGTAMLLPILVKPRRAIVFGKERPFLFQVGTNPPGVEWQPSEARRAEGQLVYRPILAWWSVMPVALRRALILAIPLLLLALLFFTLSRTGEDQAQRQTDIAASQTALAAANQTQLALVSDAQTKGAAGISAAQTAAAGGNSVTKTAAAGAIKTAQTALAGAIAQATVAAGGQVAVGGGNETSSGSLGAGLTINKFALVFPVDGVGGARPGDGLFTGLAPNLVWDVTGADNVQVSEQSVPLALSGFDTASHVSYLLVASNSTEVVTSTLDVLVIRPPAILSLDTNEPAVTTGQGAVLTWDVRGAKLVTLDNVPVDPGQGGKGQVTVSPNATHRYILCATNQAGTLCRSVKITVAGGPTSVLPTSAPPTSAPPKSSGETSAAATSAPPVPPVPPVPPAPPATKRPTNTPTPSATPCASDYTISQDVEATIVPGAVDTGNHCDQCTTGIKLPFAFKLYEQTYSSVIVGSNGTLGFVANSNPVNNACLSSPALDYAILPHWSNLTTLGTGLGVYTSVSGEAPNRIFNIEWRAAYIGGGTAHFEARLFENSPVQQFDVIYGRVERRGEGATVGVQRSTGSNFTQYECNTNDIDEGLKLSFTLQCGPPRPPDSGDGRGGRGGSNVLSCATTTADVAIRNGVFLPRSLVINIGSTVRWTNFDDTAHNISGPGFSSGSLSTGQSYQFTFNSVGAYNYRSAGDGDLGGTVNVIVACTATPTLTRTPTRTNTPTVTNTPSRTSTVLTNAPGIVQPPCIIGSVDVDIIGGLPQPKSVTINVGSTVRWTNQDKAEHSVVGERGGGFSSSSMNTGQSYQFTFTAPGTYPYHLDEDLGSRGVIVVVESCPPTFTPTNTATFTPTGTPTPLLTSTYTSTRTATVGASATPTEQGIDPTPKVPQPPSSTPVKLPTNTPVKIPTSTRVPPAPTNTSVPPVPTNTSVPPVPTNTSVPPVPTNTSVPIATATATRTSIIPPPVPSSTAPLLATNTPTDTPVLPTDTATSVPTFTFTSTATGVPTFTSTPTTPPTSTSTIAPTGTPTPTLIPTSTSTNTTVPIGSITPTLQPSPSRTPIGCGLDGDYNLAIGTGHIVVVTPTADIGNHCDNCTIPVTLPFPFRLYDQTFSSVNVSSNGNLQFLGNNPSPPTLGVCLPSTSLDYAILVFWDDLSTVVTSQCPSCGVYSYTTGAPPNREFHLTWIAQAQSIKAFTVFYFDVALSEGSQSRFTNTYDVTFRDESGARPDAGNGTIGVQKIMGGVRYTQERCNGSFPATGAGYKLFFTGPGPCDTPTPVPFVSSSQDQSTNSMQYGRGQVSTPVYTATPTESAMLRPNSDLPVPAEGMSTKEAHLTPTPSQIRSPLPGAKYGPMPGVLVDSISREDSGSGGLGGAVSSKDGLELAFMALAALLAITLAACVGGWKQVGIFLSVRGIMRLDAAQKRGPFR